MQAKGLWIPPKEVSFRLKNKDSGRVLFSREKKPDFGQFSGDVFADQWWHLEHGTGDSAGWYMIKSDFTKKIMFSRTHKSPNVGTIDSDGRWPDQWLKIEEGTGDRQGFFRLLSTSSGTVVSAYKDEITNDKADGATHDRQYWSFDYGELQFVRMDYKTKEGKILSSEPQTIKTNTTNNINGTENQLSEISFDESVNVTSTHEQTNGISVKGSYTFSWGNPVAAHSSISVEVGYSHEWKSGESLSTTKTFKQRVPVTAAPGTKVKAILKATKNTIEVPYTQTWKQTKTGAEIQCSGIYRGDSYWEQTVDFKTYDADDQPIEGEEQFFTENRALDDGAYEGEERGLQDENYDQTEQDGQEEDNEYENANEEYRENELDEAERTDKQENGDEQEPTAEDYQEEEEQTRSYDQGEQNAEEQYPSYDQGEQNEEEQTNSYDQREQNEEEENTSYDQEEQNEEELSNGYEPEEQNNSYDQEEPQEQDRTTNNDDAQGNDAAAENDAYGLEEASGEAYTEPENRTNEEEEPAYNEEASYDEQPAYNEEPSYDDQPSYNAGPSYDEGAEQDAPQPEGEEPQEHRSTRYGEPEEMISGENDFGEASFEKQQRYGGYSREDGY